MSSQLTKARTKYNAAIETVENFINDHSEVMQELKGLIQKYNTAIDKYKKALRDEALSSEETIKEINGAKAVYNLSTSWNTDLLEELLSSILPSEELVKVLEPTIIYSLNEDELQKLIATKKIPKKIISSTKTVSPKTPRVSGVAKPITFPIK